MKEHDENLIEQMKPNLNENELEKLNCSLCSKPLTEPGRDDTESLNGVAMDDVAITSL